MQSAGDRFKILWLLGALALGGATASRLQDDELPSKRLIDGTEVCIRNAPFTMQLRFKDGKFHCGGSLITPSFVITAAHCIAEVSKEKLVVVGNASSINEAGEQRNIESVFLHPKYDSHTVEYDIAVIKLDKNMTGNYVRTIPLYERSLLPGNFLNVYGWGITEEKTLSEHLRTIKVPVMAQDECTRIYAKVAKPITDAMVCAYEFGKDACRCDSGGPAVYKNSLAAVVSWGNDCAVYPGVYTRIDKSREFIDDCLKQ